MSIPIRLIKIAAICSLFAMYGCASINKAPANIDAESKQFKPNPAVSQVYVYRNETLGAAVPMPVTVDGKLAGDTGPKSFFKFNLPAGNHTITSQGNGSELSVTTEVGKIYYVWQEVKMGFLSGGSKLQIVPETVGQQGVAECTQIQSNF